MTDTPFGIFGLSSFDWLYFIHNDSIVVSNDSRNDFLGFKVYPYNLFILFGFLFQRLAVQFDFGLQYLRLGNVAFRYF